jgi:hypothetical protein
MRDSKHPTLWNFLDQEVFKSSFPVLGAFQGVGRFGAAKSGAAFFKLCVPAYSAITPDHPEITGTGKFLFTPAVLDCLSKWEVQMSTVGPLVLLHDYLLVVPMREIRAVCLDEALVTVAVKDSDLKLSNQERILRDPPHFPCGIYDVFLLVGAVWNKLITAPNEKQNLSPKLVLHTKRHDIWREDLFKSISSSSSSGGDTSNQKATRKRRTRGEIPAATPTPLTKPPPRTQRGNSNAADTLRPTKKSNRRESETTKDSPPKKKAKGASGKAFETAKGASETSKGASGKAKGAAGKSKGASETSKGVSHLPSLSPPSSPLPSQSPPSSPSPSSATIELYREQLQYARNQLVGEQKKFAAEQKKFENQFAAEQKKFENQFAAEQKKFENQFAAERTRSERQLAEEQKKSGQLSAQLVQANLDKFEALKTQAHTTETLTRTFMASANGGNPFRIKALEEELQDTQQIGRLCEFFFCFFLSF